MIFAHFARRCCLLACCSLAYYLLAQHARSTLDTKEAYKTKIGSTTSLPLNPTLTLIRIEYWDRAGGGRNTV